MNRTQNGNVQFSNKILACYKVLANLEKNAKNFKVLCGQIISQTLQPTDLSTERMVFGPIHAS